MNEEREVGMAKSGKHLRLLLTTLMKLTVFSSALIYHFALTMRNCATKLVRQTITISQK